MYNRFYTIRYGRDYFDMGNRLNGSNLNPWIDINPNKKPLTFVMTYLGLNRKGYAEFLIKNTKSLTRVQELISLVNADSSYDSIYTGSTFNNAGGAYIEFADPKIAEQMGIQVFSSSGSVGQGGFGQFKFDNSVDNRNAITLLYNETAHGIFSAVGGSWQPGLAVGTSVTANAWLPGPRMGETIKRLDIPSPAGSSGTLFIKDSLGRVTELDPSFLSSNGNQIPTGNDSYLTCLEISDMQPVQLGWTSFDADDWARGQEFRIWV